MSRHLWNWGKPGRAVMVLLGGSVMAQGLGVAITPGLTRLYSPHDFGHLGVFSSYVTVALVAVVLRYDLALVSTEDDTDLRGVLLTCLALLPVMSLAGTLLLLALVQAGVGSFGDLPLVAVPLAGLTLLAAGGFSISRYWHVRAQAFGLISRAHLLQSAVRAFVQLAFGFASLGSVGLIGGDTAGRVVGLRDLARAPYQSVRGREDSLHQLRRAARRYWKFPAYVFPSSIADTLGMALPPLLIASHYGAAAAGLFVLVQRVLSLPAATLGIAIADVFHARVAERVRRQQGGTRRMVVRTTGILLVAGAPVAIAALLMGEAVFGLVFGPEWKQAGQMAGVMAPWYLAHLAVSPVSRAILVSGRIGFKLVYDLFSLAAVVSAFLVATSMRYDVIGALTLLVAVQVVAYALYFVLIVWSLPAATLVSGMSSKPASGEDPIA